MPPQSTSNVKPDLFDGGINGSQTISKAKNIKIPYSVKGNIFQLIFFFRKF